MRIAIDARAYFQRTGIARYTRGLVSALADRGQAHEFLLLISDHHRPEEIALPAHMTAQVSRAPWLGGDDERRTLEAEAMAWDADIFHAIFPPVGLEHVRSVATIFDLTPLTHPELHQDIVRTTFTRAWAHAQATDTRLVAVSQATRRAILEMDAADPDPAVIGIGLSPPFDGPRAPDGARSGVLFVGTLEPRKNARLVLQAISRLRQQGLDVPLTIVGKSGWGDQEWQEEIGQCPSAQRVGYISDEELLARYRQAALLVCPSEVEGFGLPVLESMAQGVVPIVSRTPALMELVDDPRFTVDTDAVAIAHAIAGWMSNEPARAAASRELQARARGYSWSCVADAWVKLYSELASAGSTRRSHPTSRNVSSTKRSHVKR